MTRGDGTVIVGGHGSGKGQGDRGLDGGFAHKTQVVIADVQSVGIQNHIS